jgi:uncharacterized protein (DUF1778 family)
MGKKRGAPRKAAVNAKPELLQLRLSGPEKETFRKAAELDGKKMSEWIRDRLRRDARSELEALGQEVPFLTSIPGTDHV